MALKTFLSKKSEITRQQCTENLEATKTRKFTTLQVVGLTLLGLPTIALIFHFAIFSTFIPLLYWIIPYTIVASLFVFVLNGIDYHSFYSNFGFSERYDRIFVFHNLLYIDVFVLLVFLFSVVVQSMNGTLYVFLLILLYPISFVIKYYIVKKNGFHIPKDHLSKLYAIVLTGLVFLFFILQIFIFYPDVFLSIGIDIFLINDLLIRMKVLYEIGPIVVSFLFFARRTYSRNI